jgi:hypothetical protein
MVSARHSPECNWADIPVSARLLDANRHTLRSKPLCAKKEPPETGGFES